MILTYRYRVKSKLGLLASYAAAVNTVWNFCNETQIKAANWGRRWPSGFALVNLTSGASADLGISTRTIGAVCLQYVRSRQQHRSRSLRFRGKRSLGWVPIRASGLKPTADGFRYHGETFRVFLSRRIPPGAKIKDGCSFAQDSRGRWFINVTVELPEPEAKPIKAAVGIDLGLTTLATFSDGRKVENPRHVARMAARLATAQRARNKRLVRHLYARVKAARRDHLHKETARLVREFDLIAVGNIRPSALAKTSFAKSIYDAGWGTFRKLLAYKSIANGATYREVSEHNSTRACSECGALSGPQGRKGLVIRQWVCTCCGASHDRDVNAAVLILARSGHRALTEGVLAA